MSSLFICFVGFKRADWRSPAVCVDGEWPARQGISRGLAEGGSNPRDNIWGPGRPVAGGDKCGRHKKGENMHRSAKFQTPPNAVDFLWSCEGVFLLCFLGQIVTWQFNPNLLDKNWPCTVINDNEWHLRNGPLGKVVKLMSWYQNRNIRTLCYALYLSSFVLD